MSLSIDQIRHWAEYLNQGLVENREVDRITSSYPELSLEDAYRIQSEGVRLRESRGHQVIGMKMGLTSQAKRDQMGLHTPIFGTLTDQMKVSGGKFSLAGNIHPKIEPEIALFTSKDLRGRVSQKEVLEACQGVCAALEILDSRYKGFKYFSLPDVVADNSSSGYFVLGALRTNLDLDLKNLEMVLSVNGVPVHRAVSEEISGNPLNSVIQLCALLETQGRILPAGSLVLTGAATAAVPLEVGQTIALTVEGLSSLEIKITDL